MVLFFFLSFCERYTTQPHRHVEKPLVLFTMLGLVSPLFILCYHGIMAPHLMRLLIRIFPSTRWEQPPPIPLFFPFYHFILFSHCPTCNCGFKNLGVPQTFSLRVLTLFHILTRTINRCNVPTPVSSPFFHHNDQQQQKSFCIEDFLMTRDPLCCFASSRSSHISFSHQ